MNVDKKPNRLAKEKSPYLLQHAYNPVDWYPWTQEAFDLASKLDKPIFLSIGYSTCHWCHVMEKESFEDAEVAKLLNDNFICIKVDREERPDIDSVYMKFCQSMTGSGGWPLTIIMTPDKKPFFASTYVPKQTMYGRVGMVDLIPRIREAWNNERQDILGSAEYLTNALSEYDESGKLEKGLVDKTYLQLETRFDEKNGGFSHSPKFPTPHNIVFLIRYWKLSGNKRALEMAETTLEKMRLGGIFDQVGGGFHRYSTDPLWKLPHFEKMLYDQALLALAYIEAYEATGKEFYKDVVEEIFEYVIRDMSSEKGFCSAEDADSEGVEGKFYVWKSDEIKKILGKDADEFCKIFNVNNDGNYREEANGEITGNNILFLNEYVENDFIVGCRRKLLAERSKRIRPHKDTKILTDWNALMILSLAKAGRVFSREDYLKIAKEAMQNILDNRYKYFLLHTETISGFLDDYAFVIWALIELYQSTFDKKYIDLSQELIKELEGFADKNNENIESFGGFFLSREDIVIRTKELYDGALPSGNSVMVYDLFLLSRLTGNLELEQKAWKILESFSASLNQMPAGYTQAMIGLALLENNFYEIVLTKNDKEILARIFHDYRPNKVVLLNDVNSTVEKMKDVEGNTGIYVCESGKCNLPTNDIDKALKKMN
ncbi:MAG: thioredoxin domain-containing protein [Candidatus Aenigmarchaeota archaeon]|nr:thioredoxin domain-containing protein [Candidatus Aenigmarchaeota archaeon]